MTRAIYFENEEEWLGVDQNTDDVNYELYDQLKVFLQEYLCSTSDRYYDEEEEKWFSSIENGLTKTNIVGYSHVSGKNFSHDRDTEDVRAIPGGRYGCAQFVKICGP